MAQRGQGEDESKDVVYDDLGEQRVVRTWKAVTV